MPAKISVVIPSRNDATFLKPCLDTFAAQTRPPDEIIVVDDASSDETTAIAKAAGADVYYEPTVGIWPATAYGYDVAHGDIILRVDTDTLVPRDWVAIAEQDFSGPSRPDILCGSNRFYGPHKLWHPFGNWIYLGSMIWLTGPYLGHPQLFGSNLGLRRETWLELRELVHRDNPAIHDDLDMSFQVRPWMRVLRDPRWRVTVSDRPFDTLSGLNRRMFRTGPTAAASGREAKPFVHRRERRDWLKQHPEYR